MRTMRLEKGQAGKAALKTLWIFVMLILCGVSFAQTDEPGIVKGKIISGDESLTFGYVGFFVSSGRMPNPSRFWRVPEYISPIDKDGEFEARLPESSYYAIAIIKAKKGLGPPEPGDHFFYYMNSRGPMVITAKGGESIELPAGHAVPATFFEEEEGITMMRGIALDEKGKPVAGVFVSAYEKPVMLGKPDYISQRSDRDGRYELRVPEGGRYYIVARSRLGGPPVKGELYGRAGDEQNPVVLKTGEALDLNIKLYKVR